MGNSNPFSGSVDLGLLLGIPKGLQVLVAIEEDIEHLSLVIMEERVEAAASSRGRKRLFRVPHEL
jgi:hypothetical protein